MTFSRVGVVTGANKGIGLGIVRQLALQYPSSQFNGGSFLIYLTARDEGRGTAAVARLQEDQELKKAKALSQDGGPTSIAFKHLDITDTGSIHRLAAYLKEQHPEGLDFVINNAGIALKGFDANVVKTTLGTNYHNTLEATRAWIPLIKPEGRIVNVGSDSSSLKHFSPAVKQRFLDGKTVEDFTKLMDEFTAAVEKGTHEKDGWPSAAYSTSKAGLLGQTRAVAQELRDQGSKILLNNAHPGWVQTDMSGGRGTKTIDQGAQTPVLLAIHDIKGVSGEYWADEKILSWEEV